MHITQNYFLTSFGHRQGAFTGANSDKVGLIEQADGGYLLLDEIHRLPYEGQENYLLCWTKVSLERWDPAIKRKR